MLRAVPPVHAPAGPAAVLRSLAAGGRGAAALQSFLRERFRADDVVLVESGTQALQLAIEAACRASDGAAVALPCLGCYDLAAAAVGAGRPVVFYDLDPATLSPEPESVRRALAAGARVLVAAPLHGMPIDPEPLRALLRPVGGLLVEDAAQGHGAAWAGRPLGSFGDLSVLSFGRGKGWTGGGGGALLLRDALAPAAAGPGAPEGVVARTTRAGRVLAQWALGRPTAYGLALRVPGLRLGETHYHPPRDPRAISPFSAALALATAPAADVEAAARRERARALIERLREARPRLRPIRPVGGQPGFLRLALRVDGGRTLAGSRRARALGVYGAYPRLLPALEPLRTMTRGAPGRFPGGEALLAELVTVPTHSRVGAADRDALERLLLEWSGGGRGGRRTVSARPRVEGAV